MNQFFPHFKWWAFGIGLKELQNKTVGQLKDAPPEINSVLEMKWRHTMCVAGGRWGGVADRSFLSWCNANGTRGNIYRIRARCLFGPLPICPTWVTWFGWPFLPQLRPDEPPSCSLGFLTSAPLLQCRLHMERSLPSHLQAPPPLWSPLTPPNSTLCLYFSHLLKPLRFGPQS